MPTCDIVCILDRSGSMGSMVREAVGGFNDFIKAQRELPGDCAVTVAMFDNTYRVDYLRVPIDQVTPMTEEFWNPSGATALNDAIGTTLDTAETFESPGPDHKWIGLVITDGMENASHKWSTHAIQQRVKALETKGWEFIFIGAGIDAVAAAGVYGLSNRHTRSFAAGGQGMGQTMSYATMSVNSLRSGTAPVQTGGTSAPTVAPPPPPPAPDPATPPAQPDRLTPKPTAPAWPTFNP